jgi:hypothetical protein
MKVYDPLENDTLTARDVAELYVELFDLLYGVRPECYHVEGLWFWVSGERRERWWLIVEVEKMRQQIVNSRQDVQQNNDGAIFNSLRRMSRLI